MISYSEDLSSQVVEVRKISLGKIDHLLIVNNDLVEDLLIYKDSNSEDLLWRALPQTSVPFWDLCGEVLEIYVSTNSANYQIGYW